MKGEELIKHKKKWDKAKSARGGGRCQHGWAEPNLDTASLPFGITSRGLTWTLRRVSILSGDETRV